MSAVASVLLESPISQRREGRVFVRRLEDWIVSLVLAGMVLIPLAEALLRRTLRVGIPASTSIVQHAVLLVGMLGGAIAAREGRLLALSTLEQTWIPENLRPASRIFTSAVATTVTILLAVASAQFVLTEREAGKFLFAPLRVWWIELALPLGFIAIALRIWWRSSKSWSRRADSTVLIVAFFTSFTGASGVTILALGGLLMPILTGARYTEKNALGLLTGSGSLGLLLPPCLPLIVYAIVAHVPIQHMFLGGIVPAFVMIIVTGLWGVRGGPRDEFQLSAFDWKEARQALWYAKWELLMPSVALLALFSGFATPVEASALTALYAFLIEAVIHRDLHIFRDVPRVMAECGLLIGGVLLILGVSLGFTSYLVDAEVPARAVAWTTHNVHSPFLFLLLLNGFMLVVGCLIEIYPAIVIEDPLLVPLGAAYGIDPIRLGIIFLANLELGYLTPPVGLNLLMSSYRFRKPVGEVLRSVLPVVAVLSVGVLLITYIPGLTTVLPRWFGY